MKKKHDTNTASQKKPSQILFVVLFLILGVLFGIVSSVLEINYDHLLISLLVVYLTFFVQIIIHELGHFVVGKILGYRFIFLRLGPVSIETKNGKLKVFVKRNKGYGGACGMLPPQEGIPLKRQLWFYAGGSIFNILTLIPLLGIIFSHPSVLVFSISITATLCTTFIVLLNLWPVSSSNHPNDGKIIFGILAASPLAADLVQETNLSAALASGKRPSELMIEPLDEKRLTTIDSSITLNLLNIHFFKALDSDDFQSLARYIFVFENNLENSLSFNAVPMNYELIYYYSAINNNKEQAEKYYTRINTHLVADQDINGRRVLAAYEFYINNNPKKARQYCLEGLASFNNFPLKGQAVMEKALLTKLLSEIDKS